MTDQPDPHTPSPLERRLATAKPRDEMNLVEQAQHDSDRAGAESTQLHRRVAELIAENEGLKAEHEAYKAAHIKSAASDLGCYLDIIAALDIDKAAIEGRDLQEVILERIEGLKIEVDRLRDLGIEQVDKSPIRSIDIEDGAVDIAIQPPHWAMRAIAMSFYETLADAPNWQALEIGPLEANGVTLIVTVGRASGDSPVETVGKLRAEVERLKIENGNYWDEIRRLTPMSFTAPAHGMLAMLKRLEWCDHWNDGYDMWNRCYVCCRKENDGHLPDCELAKMINFGYELTERLAVRPGEGGACES